MTHDMEIGLILWLQERGPAFLHAMKLCTTIGDGEVVLLLWAFVYWCLDARLGLRLLLLATLGTLVGSLLKLGLHAPRPAWIDPSIRALDEIHTFGLPSGHALGAMTGWGLVAAQNRNRLARIAAAALIFLIGLSRIVLGVHFPGQVLVGWAVGGILLVAFLWGAARWDARFCHGLVVSVVSLGFILMGFLIRRGLQDWNIPANWLVDQVGAGAFPPADELLSLESIVLLGGGLLGIAAGARVTARRGGFVPAKCWNRRALCFLLGMGGFACLVASARLLPEAPAPFDHVGHYIHFALVGFWVTGAAPSIFQRLGWTRRRDEIPGCVGED